MANAHREMYMSAVHLKTILQTHTAPLTEAWPLYTTDLTDKAAKILSQLFCSTQWHTSLDLQQNQSLMSMWTLKMKFWRRYWSQSAKILFRSSGMGVGCGKGKPTPKHVALAMTVRHWTGSTKAVSYTHLRAHET